MWLIWFFNLFLVLIFLDVSVVIAPKFRIDLLLSIRVEHAVGHCCFVWAGVVHCTDVVAAVITIHPLFQFQICIFYWKSTSVFLLKIVRIWWWMSYSFFLFFCSCYYLVTLGFWLGVVWYCLEFVFVLLFEWIHILLVCIVVNFCLLLFLVHCILVILVA